MRLHIGKLCTINLTESVNGHLLYLINHLTASIVTMTRVAFGIFICQAGTHGFHHLLAYKIFRGYQLNTPLLALMFLIN